MSFRSALRVALSVVALMATSAAIASEYYVKRDTWPETVLATRAKIVTAERNGDLTISVVDFGTWHTTGWIKSANFDEVLFPEKGVDLKAKKADGKPVWTARSDFRDGVAHGLSGNQHGATYLYREINSTHDRTLSVGLGSDDGVAVWFNGKKIHSNNVPRITQIGQDRLTLELKKGKNTLLLKVYNIGGGHGFAFSCYDSFDKTSADVWACIEKDFPGPTGRMRTILGSSMGNWFVANRSNHAERKLLGTFLDSLCKCAVAPRNEFDNLIRIQVPIDDTAWLTLFERESFKKMAAAQLAEIQLRPVCMAVEDLVKTFGDRYPNGAKYQKQMGEIKARLEQVQKEVEAGNLAAEPKVTALIADFNAFRQSALLDNPLLKFDKLIFRRAKNGGLMNNWLSSCERRKHAYGNDIAVLSPVKPEGEVKSLLKPKNDTFLGDICLNWNAEKMLLTSLAENGKTWQIFEANTDGTSLKRVTPDMGDLVDNAEATYLPDGGIVFSSTATMLGVPCITGSGPVANLYRLEPDRQKVRQLTFEQDQNWCPTVLNNGRILYLRWEYTDTPHYFTRIMMSMNPDGTNQMEYFGSNSFWPNSLFFAKPVPNHPTKFVGIVSGHHGVARIGELALFDPAEGRKNGYGAVQQIPGHGKKVEPKIMDQLVADSWPKFLHPWPLNDKYFLVSCQPTPQSRRGIYLVDVFDNMILLKDSPEFGLYEPVPLAKRETPPAISPRIDLKQKDATVYLTDIYTGPGLKGVPRGTVKKLRLFTYQFSYRALGGHDCFGMESSWDSKKILGEIPVYEDGSALFKIPANTPIALQPLDEKGRSLQLMRSWFVGMPGETISCVGCHEPQNTTPASRRTLAGQKKASKLEPWFGPNRAFGFKHEIQPILDKYCVGCHDGSKPCRPNFADMSPGPRGFSKSYHALHGYLRRPGPESDYDVFRPLEYHASTSELIQMLDGGHGNIKMDDESKRKLYAWIDLNVPYFATWTELPGWFAANSWLALSKNRAEHVALISNKYQENRLKYAGVLEHPEKDAFRPDPPRPAFVMPEKRPDPDRSAPKVAGWPFSVEEAKKKQGATPQKIALGDGVELTLTQIPAGTFVMGDAKGKRNELPRKAVKIEKPFWMMTTEVTNAMYQKFDPTHDSRFIDQWSKDHTRPGYEANLPNQPVIRISWQEANAFCKWLSEKTGKKVRLPSEAEWEWACRAGTDTPFWYGDGKADFSKYADLADESLRLFVVAGIDPKPVAHADYQAFIPRAKGINDGRMIPGDVGHYEANPWGLKDMHGSVAEWTLSDNRPYPYVAADGRNGGNLDVAKIVRGGSWRDRPKRSRSGFRLSYPSWQKVFNVGFRVVVEE